MQHATAASIRPAIGRVARLTVLLASMTSAAVGHPCAGCHAREVEQYLRTGMANSMAVPQQQLSGSFTQELSKTNFRIESNEAGMKHLAQRDGVRAEYPIEFRIGSGTHAFAYLVRLSNYLFQSPIAYYTKRQIWDMAPGYERDRRPDFTRPVTPDCLQCHAGSVFPDGGLNRYKLPIVGSIGISCDRCHGSVESHLQSPSRSNIINPARLPPRARDSICEQCHLTGEARVTNPGRTFSDYKVGLELESAFSVYVFEPSVASGGEPSIKVVGHAEQLRKSVCAQQSADRLWCGTCHNPHQIPENPKSYYRERCLSCHGRQLVNTHAGPTEDCVGCHMPRRPATDGGHTAFTDHRISRTQRAGAEPDRALLTAWREPAIALAQRNLALAYLAVGERDESSRLLDLGEQLLNSVRMSFPNDAVVVNGSGVVLLRKGKKAEAVQMLRRAVELLPSSAPYRVNLATVLMEVGDLDGAADQLNRAIALDPSLEIAYRRLVEVYGREHKPEAVKATFDRYLKFRPQSLEAQAALRPRQTRETKRSPEGTSASSTRLRK